jgi:predicted dehydrogenase
LKTVKLGLIGLGGIGQLHLKHGLMLKDAKVYAVADINKNALTHAKDLGVKNTYSEYKMLLADPEVEAVVVALPTHLHLKCTQDAAEAKKHVFLEKPIAVNTQDAKEAIYTTERNGIKLMLGYPMRFNRHFAAIKQEIADGKIGDVENAHATYISAGPFMHRSDGHSPAPVPDWWFNTHLTGGGVMVDLGCHLINLLRWLFGEVVDVKAQLGYRYGMDFEDSAMCLARFTNGALAAINVGWYSQEYMLRLDLLGSVRHASVSHMPPPTMRQLTQMLIKGITEFNQPHFDELQHFVDCVRDDTAPSSTGLDGLRDLEVIEQAYKNQILV